jgi:integrase
MYFKHSSWYYVHHDMRWERLGTDFTTAKAKAETYNGARPSFGTMSYWLEEWKKHLDERVKAGDLAKRTRNDYNEAVPLLSAYLGAMEPTAVEPHHIHNYLELGLKAGRAVRANREKSALSSCLSWMLAKNHGGLKANPCKAIKRNKESARRRYITDAEYQAVYDLAGPAVRAWMELMYRTLQRPSDILSWTRSHIKADGGQEVLEFGQSKTGEPLRMLISPALRAALDAMAAARKRKSLYLICRGDGGPYTEDGISSMFRRHAIAAGVENFAPYDCKAKGATDMYEAGTPLEQIQLLCGHESVTTTERYIKRHRRPVITPNEREIQATAKK